MNINIRRGIAFILISAFLIGAPMLLLFTAGYRYNIKKNRIQKIGSLVIKTVPSRATISLNNEISNYKSPARLNNLMPDDYELTLEKENYYTWTKKLAIKSQETTFVEDVILFAKKEPQNLSLENSANFSLSHENSFVALTDAKGVWQLFNPVNDKLSQLFDQPAPNATINWAPDDSKFILKNDQDFFLFTSPFVNNFSDLANRFAKQDGNIKWDEGNSNIIVRQDGFNLTFLDLYSNKLNEYQVPSNFGEIADFLINGQEIFLITKINDKYILGKYTIDEKKNVNISKSLELNGNRYNIDNIYNGQIVLIDKERNKFYLVGNGLDRIAYEKENVKNIQLLKKENYLLIQTDQDLSFIDLHDQNFREKIITRYSAGLQKAAWLPKSANYVVALQNNRLNIIELDERDSHFILTLPPEGVTDLFLDPTGKTIYYWTADGFNQLSIQ